MSETINAAGLNFTPEQIESLRQGNAIVGSVKDGIREADVYTPSSSTPISGHAKSIKPVIRNESGDAIKQGLVTAPNMSKNNSNHEAELKRIALEQASADKEREELRSFMDPRKLQCEIQYLQRTVKRLEKSLKALTKKEDASDAA